MWEGGGSQFFGVVGWVNLGGFYYGNGQGRGKTPSEKVFIGH